MERGYQRRRKKYRAPTLDQTRSQTISTAKNTIITSPSPDDRMAPQSKPSGRSDTKKKDASSGQPSSDPRCLIIQKVDRTTSSLQFLLYCLDLLASEGTKLKPANSLKVSQGEAYQELLLYILILPCHDNFEGAPHLVLEASPGPGSDQSTQGWSCL